MRFLHKAAVLVGVLALGAAMRGARAETLTFDDLSDNGRGAPIVDGYGGLNWVNFDVLNAVTYNQTTSPSGYYNGLVSGDNVAINGYGSEAKATSGQFTFNSAYFTAAWNDGLTINIAGLQDGVQIDSTSVVVNTEGPTLESFNWTGLTELDFSSSGGTSAGYSRTGTNFAMDNMTINEETPAEAARLPSSAWTALAMMGGVGLLGLRRRKPAVV